MGKMEIRIPHNIWYPLHSDFEVVRRFPSTAKVICIPRDRQSFPQRMRLPILRPHSYSDEHGDERHHHHRHRHLFQQIWHRALLFEEVQPHLSRTIVSVVLASTTKAIFIRHRNRTSMRKRQRCQCEEEDSHEEALHFASLTKNFVKNWGSRLGASCSSLPSCFKK